MLGAADHHGGFDTFWMRLHEDHESYDSSMTAARSALGDAEFATAYAEGQVMTLGQAIAVALEDDDGE